MKYGRLLSMLKVSVQSPCISLILKLTKFHKVVWRHTWNVTGSYWSLIAIFTAEYFGERILKAAMRHDWSLLFIERLCIAYYSRQYSELSPAFCSRVIRLDGPAGCGKQLLIFMQVFWLIGWLRGDWWQTDGRTDRKSMLNATRHAHKEMCISRLLVCVAFYVGIFKDTTNLFAV